EKQELSIHVAGQYQYPLDHLIQQFKYEQQLHWQPLLSGILQQIRFPKVQAIVPMPISTQRLAERGYNQSMILAKDLAKQLNVPIWQPVIRLHQHSQKGLSRLERLDQIHQQFKIDPQQRQYVKLYRRVLILDDVVTTGSSIQALTLQLEQLGCHKVSAACIAYALE
ncbi:MAG: ComF family protein, partial [Acinetobacter sp.]|nr:ComF family protein [Acinetobacter sp.]